MDRRIVDIHTLKTAGGTELVQLMNKALDTDKISIQKAYQTVSYMRAAVRFRAGDVANVPFVIRRKGRPKREKPIYDSRLGELPPQYMWFSKLSHLIFLIEASVCLTGKAAMFIERSGRSVVNLIWMNPLSVTPIYHRTTGQLVHYNRKVNGKDVTLAIEDVVFIAPLDVFDEQHGTVPDAQAALINATIIHNLNEFLSGDLKGGLLKNMLLLVGPQTPVNERSVLKTFMDENFKGARSKKKYAVMRADKVDPVMIGNGLADLHDAAIESEQRRAIAASLRIPHSVLTSDAANYAVSQQDKLNMTTGTTIPQCQNHAAELVFQLFSTIGLHFEFQYKLIESLQTAELEQAKAVGEVVEKGILTPNEGREIIGKEPIAGGDVLREKQTLALSTGKTLGFDTLKLVRAWEKNAYDYGRDFIQSTEGIPDRIVKTIQTRLDNGEPLAAAFSPPWVDNYPITNGVA